MSTVHAAIWRAYITTIRKPIGATVHAAYWCAQPSTVYAALEFSYKTTFNTTNPTAFSTTHCSTNKQSYESAFNGAQLTAIHYSFRTTY